MHVYELLRRGLVQFGDELWVVDHKQDRAHRHVLATDHADLGETAGRKLKVKR